MGHPALFRPRRAGHNRGMTTTHETHQCPYCDLMFTYHNEVRDHIVHDHPEHAASVAGTEMHELPHD